MCISYLILVTCKGSDLRLFLKFDLGKLLPLVCRSVCKWTIWNTKVQDSFVIFNRCAQGDCLEVFVAPFAL